MKMFVLEKKFGSSSYLREIRLLRRNQHENIIKLKEVLITNDRRKLYLVLEFGLFGSLERILEIEGKIPEEMAGLIFKKVALGLQHIHNNHFVHHDIKPSNIIITSSKEIKISDFGVGRSFESQCSFFGTPTYQAPEILDDDQSNEKISSAEDIWSFGISLYEAVFGFAPFDGNTIYEINFGIQKSSLSFSANCSAQLEDILRKCLIVDPSRRITISELVNHPFLNQIGKIEFSSSVQPIHIPEIVEGANIQRIQANQYADEMRNFPQVLQLPKTIFLENCFSSLSF